MYYVDIGVDVFVFVFVSYCISKLEMDAEERWMPML
jgi:hypothetical protein